MSKPSSSFLAKVVYFFPLQLFFVHLKKNQQLLLFWLLLFLAIFQGIGLKYGIPYLFLAPEYLGELSYASYFIVGFSFGGFVIAFNISSYIMNGFRFPFLATLSKPFFKYSINNSVIPAIFILCYLAKTYSFLIEKENFGTFEALYRLFAFIIGYVLFTSLSTMYFLATNKDFEKLFGKELAKVLSSNDNSEEPAKILLKKKSKSWFSIGDSQKSWRVESYISARLKIRLCRPFKHYDQKMLSQVFRQNQINASFFEIVIILSIIFLGLFRENQYFIIPAGATIILLFTMLIMITSAIRSWIRGWTLVVIVGLLVSINQLSKNDNFYYESKAYGLSYEIKADYNSSFKKYNDEKVKADFNKTLNRLENWSTKNKSSSKPKAVFVATSGGGARASFWSFLALQHLDSITEGELFKKMIMGTGSSGGMIGSAYYRELKLREKRGELNPYDKKYQLDMTKDILNPVIFTLAINDVLIRTQRFAIANEKHWKDRGYIFEKTLNQNTHNFLNKKLSDYTALEETADIPSLIFSPSILNDSRRLLISTLPLSFVCNSSNENVDYQSLFQHNNPNKLEFSNLLRMSASFPYVMPSISLPTDPKIDVFDSGLRDNYGIKTTLAYIYQIKDWLAKNTSGIIILQIKDGLSQNSAEVIKNQSLVDEILSPFGSLYGNWFEVQKYNNNELLSYLSSWYNGQVDVIDYELNKSKSNYISLSWHLTTKEKEQILNSISLTKNKDAEKQLKNLLIP